MARKIQAKHSEYRSRSCHRKVCIGIEYQWLRQNSRSVLAIKRAMSRELPPANDRE